MHYDTIWNDVLELQITFWKQGQLTLIQTLLKRFGTAEKIMKTACILMQDPIYWRVSQLTDVPSIELTVFIIFIECITSQGVYSQLNKRYAYTTGRTDRDPLLKRIKGYKKTSGG